MSSFATQFQAVLSLQVDRFLIRCCLGVERCCLTYERIPCHWRSECPQGSLNWSAVRKANHFIEFRLSNCLRPDILSGLIHQLFRVWTTGLIGGD